MDFGNILDIALPVVFVLVGIALIWLIIELVMTARKTRETVDGLQKQLEPTLKHVENITASLEPVSAKVDPLVERVSLTVDAANLEIMRVDQILEDVSEVTDTVSSAVNAVDAAANAPLELVNNITGRLRGAFKSPHASKESVDLGEQKAAQSDQEEQSLEAPTDNPSRTPSQKKASSSDQNSVFDQIDFDKATTIPSSSDSSDSSPGASSTITAKPGSDDPSKPEQEKYFTYSEK